MSRWIHRAELDRPSASVAVGFKEQRNCWPPTKRGRRGWKNWHGVACLHHQRRGARAPCAAHSSLFCRPALVKMNRARDGEMERERERATGAAVFDLGAVTVRATTATYSNIDRARKLDLLALLMLSVPLQLSVRLFESASDGPMLRSNRPSLHFPDEKSTVISSATFVLSLPRPVPTSTVGSYFHSTSAHLIISLIKSFINFNSPPPKKKKRISRSFFFFFLCVCVWKLDVYVIKFCCFFIKIFLSIDFQFRKRSLQFIHEIPRFCSHFRVICFWNSNPPFEWTIYQANSTSLASSTSHLHSTPMKICN